MQRATELDVANLQYLNNLITCLAEGRHYDALAAALRRKADLDPGRLQVGVDLALVAFHATGSTREGEEFLSHLTPDEAGSPQGIDARAAWADSIGDEKEYVRLTRLQPYTKQSGYDDWEQDIIGAQVLFVNGDRAGALARLGSIPDDMPKRLAREPRNPRLLAFYALIELVLGHPEEAVRAGDRSVELTPASLDALDHAVYAALNARLCDHAGYKDRALAEYTRLIRVPGAAEILNVYELKRNANSSLHGDPRFEALLDDPASNEPVF
jgi:tetratricopeptide (TPR) repeat protein